MPGLSCLNLRILSCRHTCLSPALTCTPPAIHHARVTVTCYSALENLALTHCLTEPNRYDVVGMSDVVRIFKLCSIYRRETGMKFSNSA